MDTPTSYFRTLKNNLFYQNKKRVRRLLSGLGMKESLYFYTLATLFISSAAQAQLSGYCQQHFDAQMNEESKKTVCEALRKTGNGEDPDVVKKKLGKCEQEINKAIWKVDFYRTRCAWQNQGLSKYEIDHNLKKGQGVQHQAQQAKAKAERDAARAKRIELQKEKATAARKSQVEKAAETQRLLDRSPQEVRDEALQRLAASREKENQDMIQNAATNAKIYRDARTTGKGITTTEPAPTVQPVVAALPPPPTKAAPKDAEDVSALLYGWPIGASRVDGPLSHMLEKSEGQTEPRIKFEDCEKTSLVIFESPTACKVAAQAFRACDSKETLPCNPAIYGYTKLGSVICVPKKASFYGDKQAQEFNDRSRSSYAKDINRRCLSENFLECGGENGSKDYKNCKVKTDLEKINETILKNAIAHELKYPCPVSPMVGTASVFTDFINTEIIGKSNSSKGDLLPFVGDKDTVAAKCKYYQDTIYGNLTVDQRNIDNLVESVLKNMNQDKYKIFYNQISKLNSSATQLLSRTCENYQDPKKILARADSEYPVVAKSDSPDPERVELFAKALACKSFSATKIDLEKTIESKKAKTKVNGPTDGSPKRNENQQQNKPKENGTAT